jgi:hypothetical protein
MSKQKVFIVGFHDLPEIEGLSSFDLLSDQSWLDADAIVVRPTFAGLTSYESYQGRRTLAEHDSFRVQSVVSNWSNKITNALNAGKTLVFLLPPLESVNVDTGERSYSGTGRNRQATMHVAQFDNYRFIPLSREKRKPVFESGSNIVRTRDIGPLAPLYARYEGGWRYNSHFTPESLKAALNTAAGGYCVGAYSRIGLVFLPDLTWEDDDLWEEDADGDIVASARGLREARAFRDEILALHQSLRAGAERTPTPGWATTEAYALPEEAPIQDVLASTRNEILDLEKRKAQLEAKLEEAGELKSLLFETGKPLERAVRKALELLAFTVSVVDDGKSEFDAVFESAEGRFIGEVEGREKAINVSKISQLRRNVDEDFARDDVTVPAVGVLFGNGHRLDEPPSRAQCFTQKVISAAPALGIALVNTVDLFEAVQLLKRSESDEFAQQCRRAIADSVGTIVKFPKLSGIAGETTKAC